MPQFRLLFFVVALPVFVACNSDGSNADLDNGEAIDSLTVAPETALRDANVKLENIPEVRTKNEDPPAARPVATAERKKPEWLKASPFFGKTACGDWDGGPGTISASCCKYVVGNYAAILAAPGKIDVLALMTKDPFLNACKTYNKEFLDAIDRIENPVKDTEGGAPF